MLASHASHSSFDSILGFRPSALPEYIFSFSFLNVFIPRVVLFHNNERIELSFLDEIEVLSSDALNSLRVLVHNAIDTGFVERPAQYIAKKLKVACSTAHTYLSELKKAGFIKIIYDPKMSCSVCVLLLDAFLPLLYALHIPLVDNFEKVLSNIQKKVVEEYYRRHPYGETWDEYLKIRAEKDRVTSEALQNGGRKGGLETTRRRAEQRESTAPSDFCSSETTQEDAQNTSFEQEGLLNPEPLALDSEAPIINIYKSKENIPPTPHPCDGVSSLSNEQQETEQNVSAEGTWVEQFTILADAREPMYEGEAPLYTLSPDGIPIFNVDPHCSAAQNGTRYVEFQKLVNLAKKKALEELAKPHQVRFKKADKPEAKETSQVSSSTISRDQQRDEEARAYAREHDMDEDVVKVVYRLVPEDARREDLLEFLRKYPKASAYLKAICKEWLSLQQLGELPSQEELLASIEAHLEHKWSIDSSMQFIPDALSYLKNQMWIYARQWKPRNQTVTEVSQESAQPQRSETEQKLFEVRSKVVNEIKKHFNLVTGQVYGALHKARIWSVEKIESSLQDLPTFTGSIDEWLVSVRVSLG